MAALLAASSKACTCAVRRPASALGHCGRSRHCSTRAPVRLRAAADSGGAPEAEPQPVGRGITFSKDTESLSDVFAFAGPAPERVNGRVAMWAFLAAVAAEAASGRSVLEQLAAAPLSVAATAALIAAGSLAPKFASGVSLSSLIASAGREGLPPQLRFFNKTHELWLGRVAMLGFVGLVGTELVLRRALF